MFYLEIEDLQLIQSDSDQPATDYFETPDEDLGVDGIVATIDLTDYFSVGPTYTVEIVSGRFLHDDVMACQGSVFHITRPL